MNDSPIEEALAALVDHPQDAPAALDVVRFEQPATAGDDERGTR